VADPIYYRLHYQPVDVFKESLNVHLSNKYLIIALQFYDVEFSKAGHYWNTAISISPVLIIAYIEQKRWYADAHLRVQGFQITCCWTYCTMK